MAKNIKEENNYPQYQPFPLYVLLVCGIIISIVGLHLLITETVANGATFSGRLGRGGGNPISLSGQFTLAIGLIICVFPIYQLNKESKRSK
ncbi:hypothetical protein [Ferruginibacter sp.]|uniref:hypothetical protein n=1 Tax=Ferruginibacter sp. TaxID=1940288 RepID=UPI0019C7C4FA|nr:hypothetical protein [Ferruginibacter sp.]MBC7625917.1 hypothetical protein [Ferruginibacter sp.]